MKKKILLISIAILSLIVVGCDKQVVNNTTSKTANKDIEVKKEINDEANELENEEVEETEVEEVVVKESKTIVIDPGHSSVGNREKEPIAPNSQTMKTKDVLGATGVFSKVPEHITTVAISNILKEKLTDMGFNVIMTKDEVEKSLSNVDRAKIGNEANADLVVRIHADSSESNEAKGASVLIPPKNQYTSDISEASLAYGEKIISTYTNELNIKNRGTIYRDDMTGFNWSQVPVVILEMGFLSNKEDDLFLSDEANHDKIATSIANSIKLCFE